MSYAALTQIDPENLCQVARPRISKVRPAYTYVLYILISVQNQPIYAVQQWIIACKPEFIGYVAHW